MNKRLLLIATFLLFSFNTFSATNSLCRNDEKVLFACLTKNEKSISICASNDLSATSGYMQYRFGKKNNIELDYPATKLPPNKEFTGRSQMFSGGGGVYLRFNKNDYDYILYSGIGKGWDVTGLVLLKNAKLFSYFPCKTKPISEITPQKLEELRIPLDPEDKEFFPGDLPLQTTSAGNSDSTLDTIKTCYDNAETTIDMRKCADSEYNYYDGLLNQQYNALMKLLSQSAKNQLIDAQKAWLVYRKKECDFQALQNEGGSIQPLTVVQCYNTLNKQRIADINELIKSYQN